MTYTMWKDVPVPFFMSVYFFHVLNPKEILNGEKPMVEQRGPYVYRYTVYTNMQYFPQHMRSVVTTHAAFAELHLPSGHFVLQTHFPPHLFCLGCSDYCVVK